MQTLDLDYAAEGATLRGYLACEEGAARRPGVLVFHEGAGTGARSSVPGLDSDPSRWSG